MFATGFLSAEYFYFAATYFLCLQTFSPLFLCVHFMFVFAWLFELAVN